MPVPGDNEFVVEITHISVDPAMRGWMNAARSYVPPVEIGEVMRAMALGGPVTYLDDEEARRADASVGGTVPRPWELCKKMALPR